jgi:guanine nucleotide-binding protein subunit alpha
LTFFYHSLLGAGESGKSTLVKQIRLIHGGFTNEERQAFREIVVKNLLQSMVTLLESVALMGLSWQIDGTATSPENGGTNHVNCATMSAKLQQHAKGIGKGSILLLPMDLVETITYLWRHPTIQQVYKRRNEYQLNDSAA